MSSTVSESFTSSDDYASFLRGELAVPFDLYATMRREEPVHWAPEAESWVLTKYRDVQAISQFDVRVSSDRLRRLLSPVGGEAGFESLHDHLRTWVTFLDPPDHTRMRDTAKRNLAPAEVSRMEGRISVIVDNLLTQMETRHEPDLIRDLAFPLPAMVVCEVLGVPTDDLVRLQDWSNRAMRFMENVSPNVALVAADANAAIMEMTVFLEPLVQARRESPREDLISALVPLVDSGKLSSAALYGWCLLLLIAGHETTTGLIGNAVTTLLQYPEAMTALREDPSKVERAIEEVLRFESPVDRQTRLALEDLVVGGRTIAAGDRMYLMLAAANRDPEAFPDPDRFDINRSPNRHLGFGYGIHFCLGAALARLEARTAILAILDRYPHLALAGTPTRWRGQTMRRFESAPIALGMPNRT